MIFRSSCRTWGAGADSMEMNGAGVLHVRRRIMEARTTSDATLGNELRFGLFQRRGAARE